MRGRIVLGLLIAWIVPAASAADRLDRCCSPHFGHCTIPPPSPHPKCTLPCDKWRLCLCPPWHVKETYASIEQLLHCPNPQARKRAAEQLGCRWHADFCRTPEVLTALIAALHCDACWQVRRAAATSLRQQEARTPLAILALYIASNLDPHYLVRQRANESIDILLVLERPCYKQLFKNADGLIDKLQGKYKPGTHDCRTIYSLCGEVLSRSGGPSNLPEEAKSEAK